MASNSEKQATESNKLVVWTEKQKEALRTMASHKFTLYGGAMGGGKSFWLRWTLIMLLGKYAQIVGKPGVTVGLFCEDYPALRDRHIQKLEFEVPKELGWFNKQEHNLYLTPENGGGILAFRNLKDASAYQSAEFAAIAVDELTKNPETAFNFLRTRLRWPGIDQTRFIAGTNWGGIGHVWVKRKWLDREFEPGEKEADEFAFIPSLATDNPHLPQSYYDTLAGLPAKLKKAFVEGDPNMFDGQYFDEWRNEIHVCKPFEVPVTWKRFVCIDYGYSKPAAAYWCAVDFDKRIWVYRELYATGNTFRDLARQIITFSGHEQIDYWVADPAIWAKGNEKEGEPIKQSGVELMYEVANEMNYVVQIVPGNNDRLNGWRMFREYLQTSKGKDGKMQANITFFSTCIHAIETIPALVYDSVRVEDLDSEGEDHAADALRYGLMSRPQPPSPAKNIGKGPVKEVWADVDKDLPGNRGGGSYSGEQNDDRMWG